MFMCRRQLPQAGKLIKMSKLQWGWCKSLWLWQQQLSGREGGRNAKEILTKQEMTPLSLLSSHQFSFRILFPILFFCANFTGK